MEKDFISQLRLKLRDNGISLTDIDFILTFISPSQMDENLWVMDNKAYKELAEHGLWEPLLKATRELGGGDWVHNESPC